ncbi:NADP-dependent oxidoreductase [Sorangium cellulosum]|uniref:NADP-dependent oxidoreductase n=1 Tax=Sorangium cellulosum TaxID=56 RepID=A0A150PUS6_SORCE|nr:NADP-dependent oxidoreductase [Sorangium cellulosum]
MTPLRNRKIVLAARPSGEPKVSDFKLIEEELSGPGEGRALLRTLYLSLDPYMRGRMNAGKSYAPPVEVGDVMVGGTVSEVVRSSVAGLSPGDIVEGRTGWQAYAITDGSGLRKVDPALGPISTALGVLGMPGMTAYTGLLNLGQPKPGETVVVAAASGAVGSVVGQIAKIKGCRVVGVAGGQRKCDHVVNELGFDACVDHRSPDMADRLKAACPDGIDVYFENVGGAVFEAVLPLLNPFARVPVCGLIAHYNDVAPPPGPDRLPGLMMQVLSKRLTLRGFIVGDFAEQRGEFLEAMSRWIREGRVKYREDIVEGLEKAPEAFIGLLEGKNFGKLLVRVAA